MTCPAHYCVRLVKLSIDTVSLLPLQTGVVVYADWGCVSDTVVGHSVCLFEQYVDGLQQVHSVPKAFRQHVVVSGHT